jgi:hypothetical protein
MICLSKALVNPVYFCAALSLESIEQGSDLFLIVVKL